MNKYIYLNIILTIVILMNAVLADARPCNKQEQAIHRMFSPNTICYKPDPHPLPHGIAYPKFKNLPDSAVYFINLTNSLLNISKIEYLPDVDGGGETSGTTTKLPSRTYTYVFPIGGSSYDEFIFSDRNKKKKEKIIYPRNNNEPVVYKFIVISQSHGRIYIDEVSKSHAIDTMKKMRYVK